MLAKKIGRFAFETLQVVVFAISIFLFIYLLVMQPHKIKGASMEPSFINGQFLLTDKISYRFGEPSRGDVVVFLPPGMDQDFIKRIVALPGDEVRIRSGQVILNGSVLVEPYLLPGEQTPAGKFLREDVTMKIPSGEYFLLGDNRHNSLDSRNFGFVPKSNFTGKAWFVYWPLSESGRVRGPTYSL